MRTRRSQQHHGVEFVLGMVMTACNRRSPKKFPCRSLLQHLGFEDMLPAIETVPETPPAEATADDVDAAAAHLGEPLLSAQRAVQSKQYVA